MAKAAANKAKPNPRNRKLYGLAKPARAPHTSQRRTEHIDIEGQRVRDVTQTLTRARRLEMRWETGQNRLRSGCQWTSTLTRRTQN